MLTLWQLCADCVRNRGLLVREGGIPPLVALSQTGTTRAKHKVSSILVNFFTFFLLYVHVEFNFFAKKNTFWTCLLHGGVRP